jgi:hypothetical protein
MNLETDMAVMPRPGGGDREDVYMEVLSVKC